MAQQQWQGILLSTVLALAGCLPAPATPDRLAWSRPHVIVRDQALVDGQVTVAEVVIPQAGWLVIHRSQAGNLGEVIGLAAVHAGVNPDVVVPIDGERATPTLYALLHIDAGQPGVYEFPGADAPLIINNPPMLAFQLRGRLPSAGSGAGEAVGFGLYFPLIMHNPALTGTVNRQANLRAGPSRTFAVIGRARFGQSVSVVACNQACTWYRLAGGEWIAASLVSGVADRHQTLPLVATAEALE